MNRQQRETELREMLTTQRGKEELLATLKQHAGIQEGNLPSFGTLLVDTILNYEYPPDHERRDEEPARVGEEPGDAKFAEPPAQESLGG
jgi:hypothetical protein